MMYAKLRHNDLFEKLFLLFIIIQPILDLITGLTLKLTDSQFSLSLIIRTLFLMIFGLYLIFFKNYPYHKKQLLYFLILAIYLCINLCINYFMKPQFYLASEIKFILKAIYFVVTLSIYAVVFKTTHLNWKEKSLQYIYFAMTIYSSIILIAGITGTSFPSYEWEKVGHVGWFYSGNEIGAVLSIGFPVVLLTAIKKSRLYWLPVLIMIYALFAIGTKVGYGTILLVMIIALAFTLLDLIVNRGRAKKQLKTLGILTIILIGTFVYTPFSPIAQNMGIHLSILNEQNEIASEAEQDLAINQNSIESDQVQDLMLSGRDTYLDMHKSFFAEAPLSQKLFGMGYGGNYSSEPKMIEMDFHDLFYSFGIIGMIILTAPIIYCIIKILYNGIKKFKQCYTYENILLASSCALGFGIAFLAGHILTAPGVSFYLAVIVAYLTVNVEQT
ncbi:O-antigen ligase family protein [Bacillus sp. AGMB 02131]|uniref:O-antigen ligase family protein n=1 Tax=Peribacillus faecalis TaxID=2772559 RepID=A0A927CWM9_9BACI|nr:O-antigen ligase family protein [Peribacillus faecalis]MBD3108529.1 O-antigen ligase family protein [Peribacillus faecalis]